MNPPEDFDRWFLEHARCGTCAHLRRDLFTTTCGVSGEPCAVTDPACGSPWDPNDQTRPAFEASLQNYLEWASGVMDEVEVFLEVLP